MLIPDMDFKRDTTITVSNFEMTGYETPPLDIYF
jgi:hypothetical protein